MTESTKSNRFAIQTFSISRKFGNLIAVDGKPRRRQRGRTDYLLRIRVNLNTQPIAIALMEAKRDDEPLDKGLEQAKKYARLNHATFVYSSNGYRLGSWY